MAKYVDVFKAMQEISKSRPMFNRYYLKDLRYDRGELNQHGCVTLYF